jgi:hypothetical protein
MTPALGTLALFACNEPDAPPRSGDSSPPEPVIGADVTVTAFEDEHVYFTGEENLRQVDRTVSFPEPGQRYDRITLHVSLACPTGGCDFWDRLGRLSIVDDEGQEIELARFITPYRVGADFSVDVTDLQRLLEGERTLRVFVDTWVGPDSPYGEGWLVDASFDFQGGLPQRDPFAVVALWAPRGIVYGDPARPTAQSATADVLDGATGARLRALVTGHGQGNAENCAEFCSKEHTFTLGAKPRTKTVWRDDCETAAAPGQQGTYQYPRAGWCPGAMVDPWIEDVDATAGPLAVGYDVEAYENTCRPDATTCSGCTLGSGCDYNDSTHTEPNYQHSALLVLLR